MRWTAALGLLLSGCQGCQPAIDPDPVDTDDATDSNDSDTDAVVLDTAPEPPCAQPEVESNDNYTEANALALASLACGSFSGPLDVDHFRFETDESTWAKVDLRAYRIGSLADVDLVVVADDGSMSATMGDHQGTPDALLRFPVEPGGYVVRVSQSAQGGAGKGEDFFYELIALEDKEPLEYELLHDEATELTLLSPQSGAELVMLGGFDAAGDVDRVRFTVPAGRHGVTLRAIGHELGSSARLTMKLYNGLGQLTDTVYSGEIGWEPDPWFSWESEGSEIVEVEIVEDENKDGPAYWYALAIDLEPR